MDTPDSYRERLKALFETSYWCAVDTDDEVLRIRNALKYDGEPLSLFQYRKITKESVYNLISGTQTLTAPDKFNDIFDSFPYYNTKYFENSFLNLDEDFLRNLINIARTREFTSEEIQLLGSPLAVKIVKRLSSAPQEVLEDEFFKFFQQVKEKGWEDFCVYAKNLVKHLQHSLRITCLCERYDCPTMWGHYADSGRGFCLQYPAINPFYKLDFSLEHSCCSTDPNCKNKGRLSLLPVIYDERRFNCARLIECRYNYLTADRLNIEPDYLSHDFLEYFKVSCFKAQSWQYEREWRLILEGAWDCPDYYNVRALFPNAIYLGPQISATDEAFLVQIAKALQSPTGEHLAIYKMCVDENEQEYKLIAREYSEFEKK